MQIRSSDSLRARLRSDLSSAHELLDTGISALDIATCAGFTRFLQIHHSAFRALSAASPAGAAQDELSDLATRTARDLDVLNGRPTPVPDAGERLDGIALDYTLQGSRLGTRVLKRRWEGASDPRLCAARSYFDATIRPEAWRATCDRLGRLPAHGPAADQTVRDAGRIFGIYRAALALALLKEGHPVD